MLSQEERVALFKSEVEALEKKYQLEIVAILNYTPQGIIPGLTALDKKPAFVSPSGAEITPKAQMPQIDPIPTNGTPKSSIEKN